MRKTFWTALAISAVLASGITSQAQARAQQVWGMGIAASAIALYGLIADQERDDGNYATLGGGWYDAIDTVDEAGEAHLEFRPGVSIWKLQPLLGVGVTTDGSVMAYAGGRFDVFLGDDLVLSPSLAPAVYAEGDGKDLGSNVVLRFAIDAQYKLENDSRLGLGMYHMSHGNVFGDDNPGVDTLFLSYTIPFGR